MIYHVFDTHQPLLHLGVVDAENDEAAIKLAKCAFYQQSPMVQSAKAAEHYIPLYEHYGVRHRTVK